LSSRVLSRAAFGAATAFALIACGNEADPAGASGGTAGVGGSSGDSGSAGAGGSSAGTGAAAGSGTSGSAGAGGSAGGTVADRCIVPATQAEQPALLSQTGCMDPSDPKKPASGLIPYRVNSQLWSDGAAKERYLSLPPGSKIRVKDCDEDPASCERVVDGGSGEEEGHFGMPVGTVLVKVFLLGGKRIETRLLTRFAETTWVGFSYEWNDDETDATLLPDFKDKPVGSQTWHYPSRSQCLECHTKAGGRSLGPTTAQLDRDYEYPDGTANQLDRLVALGHLDARPKAIPPYPDPLGDAPLEARARSYLHANCSICHRDGGTVSDVDLRFTTSFADTALCNQSVIKSTGDPLVPQIRLVPGSPEESTISFRMHDTTDYRMPKIGSSVVDPDGTALIDAWITSIEACP
jgi:hypothetical protein